MACQHRFPVHSAQSACAFPSFWTTAASSSHPECNLVLLEVFEARQTAANFHDADHAQGRRSPAGGAWCCRLPRSLADMPVFNCLCSMQAPKAAHAGQPRALAPLPVRHNARWVTRAEGESGKVEKKGDDKGSKKVQKVKAAAASMSGVWQPSARSRASLSLFGALGGQADCLMPPSRLAIARSAMSSLPQSNCMHPRLQSCCPSLQWLCCKS